MRLWGRSDRIGGRLVHEIGDEAQSIHNDRLYVLDVELWHRGTDELARAAIREIRLLIETQTGNGERLWDSFVGQLLCLARVAVRGEKLAALLELDIVAEVDMPPQPVFDHRQALRMTSREYQYALLIVASSPITHCSLQMSDTRLP
jgi:hypothetical protein